MRSLRMTEKRNQERRAATGPVAIPAAPMRITGSTGDVVNGRAAGARGLAHRSRAGVILNLPTITSASHDEIVASVSLSPSTSGLTPLRSSYR